MVKTPQFAGMVPAGHERRARQAALKAANEARGPEQNGPSHDFPVSKMPAGGWSEPVNLRGKLRAVPPSHRVSSLVLGTAYPFLAESGESFKGPYIGRNMLSRGSFSFDPWEAYATGQIRSHSVALLGVKGTGKSMLAKSWSTRLIRTGRCVAVPHDPNGEWVRVAEYVGGRSVAVGPGTRAKLNFLDAGPEVQSMGRAEWEHHVLQTRRASMRTVLLLLQPGRAFEPEEHTVLDVALADLGADPNVVLPMLHRRFEDLGGRSDDLAPYARRLAHMTRRLVEGDLAGMFDGPSTIQFDAAAPMMVVDTSALKAASKLTQAIARLATTNWIRQATTGSNRRPRVIVHEEAAVELMNMVAAGEGLTDQVANEKVARHDGVSSWYLIHRIADLNSLGDEGSALRSQALGLLSDCETRVTYQQRSDDIASTARQFGWNDTLGSLVRKLKKGEGLWQIGDQRMALVKNVCTDGELGVFRTDALGGVRA